MRRDMAKILCETYKVGGRWDGNRKVRHSKRFNEYVGEVGGKIGIHKALHVAQIDGRSFGENLAPLYRYVSRQVGRPWSKVYSEICASCEKNGAVNNHIFLHLYDYIVRPEEVKFRDGKPGRIVYGGWKPIEVRQEGHYYKAYYVDPRDGLIKKAKVCKRTPFKHEQIAQEKAKRKKVINDYLEFHKIEDLWFKYELADCPRPIPVFLKPTRMSDDEWNKLTKSERETVGVKRYYPGGMTDVFRSTWRDKSGKERDIIVPDPSPKTYPNYYRSHSYFGSVLTDIPLRFYKKLSTASKAEKKQYNLE